MNFLFPQTDPDGAACAHASRGLRPIYIGAEVYRKPAYHSHHPLAIRRAETVEDICRALGWLNEDFVASPTASRAELLRFHDAAYVDALRQADSDGYTPGPWRERFGLGTMENPVFRGVFDRAATAVGGSVLAARLAAEGRIVFHPAGGTHHGLRARASGFCYFNDPVFAGLEFLDLGLSRIAFVDLDAHHGDGVEEAFAHDERVLTVSIHERGRWPYSGALDDRREGRAFNLPVPEALNDSEFDWLIDNAVSPLLLRFAPQAIVIVCGADALKGDPLSRMALSNRRALASREDDRRSCAGGRRSRGRRLQSLDAGALLERTLGPDRGPRNPRTPAARRAVDPGAPHMRPRR